MKKVLISLLVLVCTVTLAGPVMAKTLKPPKSICLELDNDGARFCMGTKKGITMLFGDTKLPMYTIQGAFAVGTPLPADGTGYMLGSLFVFHLSTSSSTNIDLTGIWDVVTQIGEASLNKTTTAGFTSTQDTLLLYTVP